MLNQLYPLVLLALTRPVHGYEPNTGSEATGDLNANAPYGLPASQFKSETSDRKNASATFNITGYDVSANQGLGVAPISGWAMSAAVASEVPLTDSTDDIAKDKVTEATTLSVIPPSGMEMDDSSWTVCAVVYPGLSNTAMSAATTVDGSCNNVLSNDCIKQLTVTGSTSALASNGSCTGFTLPAKCSSDFPSGANGTTLAINSTVLSENRFYAYGAEPVDSGNTTALTEAVNNIWPVLLIWAQLSNGQLASTVPAMQCVSASANGTGDDSSAAHRLASGNEAHVWWLLTAVVGMVLFI